MIILNYQYNIFFTVEVSGVATNADSTPTAVLYRNGSVSDVTVTISTTATTGLYKATFTTLSTDDEWDTSDILNLIITATINSVSGYVGVVWDSIGGGGNSYYFNNPIQSSQISRNTGNLITAYEGETSPITISDIEDVYENPIDLSEFTLLLVITEKNGKVLQEIESVDITVTGDDNNNVTFTNNAEVTKKGRASANLLWSLRDADNGNKVLVEGELSILKTATSDAD